MSTIKSSAKNDLVSVFMSVFNGLPFLPQAIESILSQTHQSLELIIINDASTDQSAQIINQYQKKDSRVRAFHNQKNMGVGHTANQGIKKAKGQYLARIDADDLMLPSRLAKQLTFLKKHPKVIAVGTWTKEIDKKGKIIGQRQLPTQHGKIYKMMFYAMGLQHPTIMINRKLVPSNFKWYPNTRRVIDLDMLFRLIKHGQFANIPKYLTLYRIHDKNLTFQNTKKTFEMAQEIRKKAVSTYGYKPTLKARLINLLEAVLVKTISEKQVFKFYSRLRKLG